ncbi:hypothetical protein [Ruminococcus sp. YE78]|uniref:hypothetical protein n=1 Tax=Ruminococcus sp. YE78 TaxID=1352374 RepID=UPI001FA7E95B|nr:hypothetical protein [Ruminococcus sp. YE78]
MLRKYAVYKADTGYYCCEYYDTLESLEACASPLKNVITEEQLPVVFDGKGGYRSFDPENDFAFVEIIESDEKYPLPLEQMFFKNHEGFQLGWISPDGDTYSCDFTGHAKCAVMLADKFYPDAKYPERTLGRKGWIKVIDSWDGVQRQHGQFVYSMTGKMTNRQADKLYDLGLYDNPEVRQMLKDSEDFW